VGVGHEREAFGVEAAESVEAEAAEAGEEVEGHGTTADPRRFAPGRREGQVGEGCGDGEESGGWRGGCAVVPVRVGHRGSEGERRRREGGKAGVAGRQRGRRTGRRGIRVAEGSGRQAVDKLQGTVQGPGDRTKEQAAKPRVDLGEEGEVFLDGEKGQDGAEQVLVEESKPVAPGLADGVQVPRLLGIIKALLFILCYVDRPFFLSHAADGRRLQAPP